MQSLTTAAPPLLSERSANLRAGRSLPSVGYHRALSAEVTATDHATMLAEGHKLAAIAPNVVVKTPLTVDGLKTC